MKIEKGYLDLLKAKFLLRTKGYCLTPRNRYYLVINKDLTEEEYFLYGLLWDILIDWDDRHVTYGLFEIHIELLANFLHWSSSKTRRILKSLVNKNFVLIVSKNQYTLTGYDLRIQFSNKSSEFSFYKELKQQIIYRQNNNFKNENNNVKNS